MPPVASPKVFITQQPRPNGRGWTPNLSPAAKFGAMEFVFQANDLPWCNTSGALRLAERVLDKFNADRDYVLWPNSGDPAAAWAVMLTLARKGLKQIRVLYWERELKDGRRSLTEGFYTPITFSL